MTINIEFTKDELAFAKGLVEFARTKLEERGKETHSGVDQFLINGFLISTSELLAKLEAHNPSESAEVNYYESVEVQG
jgi:hypothetical protein